MNVPIMYNNESDDSDNALVSPCRSRSLSKCPGRRGSMQTSSSSAISPVITDNGLVNKPATLNENTNTLDWKPLKPRRKASPYHGGNLKLDDSSAVSVFLQLYRISQIRQPSFHCVASTSKVLGPFMVMMKEMEAVSNREKKTHFTTHFRTHIRVETYHHVPMCEIRFPPLTVIRRHEYCKEMNPKPVTAKHPSKSISSTKKLLAIRTFRRGVQSHPRP